MTAASSGEVSANLHTRLTVLLVLLVSSTVIAVGAFAAGIFESAVAPELGKRTRLIGVIVRAEMQRALELGVELEAMRGLDRYLSDTLEKFAEVERIVVRDAAGAVVAAVQRSGGEAPGAPATARHDRTQLPILDGNRLVGEMQIDISRGFVRTRLRDVLFDVMSLALVAALVAQELAAALAAAAVSRPLERVRRLLGQQAAGDFSHRITVGGMGGLAQAAERLNDHAEDLAVRLAALPAAWRERVAEQLQAQLAHGMPPLLRIADAGDIRISLFLFAAGSSVALSFLPVFAGTLARAEWISAGLAAAAPLLSYLLVQALLTPYGAQLVRRVGSRRLFFWSMPAAALSLAGMALASSVAEISLWRGVIGAVFAVATIACQEYAIRSTASPGSARPMSIYNAALYSGIFCGAALGGVVAGRFGVGAAFVSGALMCGLSGLVAARAMDGPAGDAAPAPVVDAPVAAAPRTARATALWCGLMLPMSASTAVIVWFLTPLALSADGSGPAEVGRVVMLYYLSTVLLGPTVSVASDGRVGPGRLVLAGAALAAAALLSMTWWSGFWAIVTLVVALGIGHALMRAPLFALALRCDVSGAAINRLRLAERAGAIAGLVVCALSLRDVGAAQMAAALGFIVTLGLAAYLWVDRWAEG